MKHNQIFQKVAAQSGSFWYEEGDDFADSEWSGNDSRFYIDSGSPNDNSDSTAKWSMP